MIHHKSDNTLFNTECKKYTFYYNEGTVNQYTIFVYQATDDYWYYYKTKNNMFVKRYFNLSKLKWEFYSHGHPDEYKWNSSKEIFDFFALNPNLAPVNGEDN